MTVIADLTAGRTQRWLDELAATGQLPDHHRAALAADDARTTLDQLLRTVELAGHDPRRALTDAVTASPLDGSTSVAQVLHFRIRDAHDGRLTPRVAGYADLLPRELPEQTRDGLHALAAGGRRAAGRAGRPARPGPAAVGPRGPRRRPRPRARPRRAGPLGAAGRLGGSPTASWSATTTPPTPSAPPRRPGWRRRWPCSTPPTPRSTSPTSAPTRNGCPKAGSAPAGPPGSANTTPPRATSPTTWKPPTAPTAGPAPTPRSGRPAPTPRPTRWSATRSPPPPGRPARPPSRLAAQIEQLTYADDARAAFLVDSAVTRDRAERARVAAGLRGINLDDQSDRVTAQEWLDAHLADQRADEAQREITEDDISRDDEHTDARPTTRAPPTSPTTFTTTPFRAGPDPTEQAEPAARRRVPPPDATTAAFDRAQQVLREVAERQQAEQAAAAHAAELESEDEQLRAELARQAAYDSDAGTDRQSDADEDVDGDEMPHREW